MKKYKTKTNNIYLLDNHNDNYYQLHKVMSSLSDGTLVVGYSICTFVVGFYPLRVQVNPMLREDSINEILDLAELISRVKEDLLEKYSEYAPVTLD